MTSITTRVHIESIWYTIILYNIIGAWIARMESKIESPHNSFRLYKERGKEIGTAKR